MIEFGKDICTDLATSVRLEWLETNGIGGFAAGTVAGPHTRRYHGLLVAAARPPLGRVVLLAKFEEQLNIDGETYPLSANCYPDAVYPQGFRFLTSFRLTPFPVWTFAAGGIEIEKKIFMPHGSNTTVCQWSVINTAGRRPTLELKPLVAFRDYHHLRLAGEEPPARPEFAENAVLLSSGDGQPDLFLAHNAVAAEETRHWYRNFEYEIERQRGFDFREDLYQPVALRFDLSAGPARVIASTGQQDVSRVEEFEQRETERRRKLSETAGAEDELTKRLVLAADQFVVDRGEGKTIIAGYPWFSDWGRDTMISLSGLTLATNRPEIARHILGEFAGHLSEGMLPNRFPDEGEEPEYNTVDATLWYFEAIRAYVEQTGDAAFVRAELYEKLKDTIEWHLSGTRYGIRAEPDGLLSAGEEGVQLTWMDARIGDWVVTPRIGKPVEIQALWYNALRIMEDLADRFADAEGKKKYSALAGRARKSFNREFWNKREECLFDVVRGEEKDASIRPNQIFAVSLRHSMLGREKARQVIQKVEEKLLTPRGLRSLAPGEADYRPVYRGSPFERDSAYHQGTVWAWLIGPFLEAFEKVAPKTKKSEKRLRQLLDCFREHLFEEGLGQISEIFDGDPPHEPRGCFAQAWSVAEILRVMRKI